MRLAVRPLRPEYLFLAAGVVLIGMAGMASLRYHLFQSVYVDDSRQMGASNATLKDNLLFSTFRSQKGSVLHTVGRLEIPRVRLSVLVVEGDEEQGLEVAAVHLAGTAPIGHVGNAVIAGHRDTAFWPLRNVKTGDSIRVGSSRERSLYMVDSIRVVPPSDLSVLQSSSDATLTLLTCYPFRYVGSAPERFVVRAHLIRQ